MKLKILEIDLKEEIVKIKVIQNCNLMYYILSDSTYSSSDSISNELRHIFWFTKKEVKEGDFIYLYSKKGTNTSIKNSLGTTTYFFYWNLNINVWNNTGDCAVLFELNTWSSFKAK